MIKILFLIHDLGQGGAEKVLVNLVNNMDLARFDVSVIALFGGGVNEQFLRPEIKYRSIFSKMFPGNSHVMKILSPELLHKWFVKGNYDIEISYLEGPSARVISGCRNPKTKMVSWIHVEQHNIETLAFSFRSAKEAMNCYNQFDKTVCVSEFVKKDFTSILNYRGDVTVLYNTTESEKVRTLSQEKEELLQKDGKIRLVAVGTLKESKGYGRLLRIIKKLLLENYPVHLYVLGEGPMRAEIEQYIRANDMEEAVTLLGYQTNPYKYVANCDLLVCASFAEGFSTAVTEALILGIPVCTVDVSGMRELLGNNNEYGIVTVNDEDALYKGIKTLLDDDCLMKHYKQQAKCRGNKFETRSTVAAVEEMLLRCVEDSK